MRMHPRMTGMHAHARRRVTPPDSRLTRSSEARASQGWRADAVSYSREELRRDPGVYLISVVSNADVESDYALEVQRASVDPAPALAPADRAALEQVLPLPWSCFPGVLLELSSYYHPSCMRGALGQSLHVMHMWSTLCTLALWHCACPVCQGMNLRTAGLAAEKKHRMAQVLLLQRMPRSQT
jgi:hypothetical protein